MTRIIGPSGSGRRRRSLFGAIGSFLLLALILVPTAQAVLVGSPSKFESGNDPTLGLGNMIVTVTGNTDWVSVTADPNYVHLTDLAASNNDDSFTSGQKQDTTCPTIEGHKNPPKDDFTDVASFSEVNSDGGANDGDTYLYGATIRYAANGNASENIELKQGTSGDCAGGLLARTPGDKLIAIDYLGGGSAVQFHVLTWVASGPCFVGSHTSPCWGANVITLNPATAEGGVNATAITAADNPISGKALVAGQFAEFGINLADAGIIPSGECKTFSQTVWESRASGSSFVSTTKDVSIEDQDINNCASVSVTKTGSDGGSQEGAVFTLYAGTIADGDGTVVGTCMVDDQGVCQITTGSFTDLNPGDYHINETTVPTGYSPDPDLPFDFTLDAGETEVLSFEDVAQTGAIVITKTAKHADTSGATSANLVAGFTITDSNDVETTTTTDVNGAACVDGLPPGDATVSETDPPDGYSAGPDVTVTVAAGTNCTNADGVPASFENIPLTNITVSVDSQVEGGTSSTITCGSEPTVTTEANGDGSLTLEDLEPNVPDGIVCTIVIDP
jgi:hypothetical protein